jgi:hypothetical protein
MAVLCSLCLVASADAAETGGIAGKVTDTSNGLAIVGIEVCAFAADEEDENQECATTNSGGEYMVSGLASGSYKVEFSAPFNHGLNYVSQYYNGKSAASEGDVVTVLAGNVTSGIDAELHAGGSISGRVTDAAANAPLEGVLVCAFANGFEAGGCAISNSNGEYTVLGLAGGEYKVGFADPHGHATQYYSGKALPAEANLVAVTLGNVTPQINAALQPGRASTEPVNVTPPAISGPAALASSLACSNGLWVGNPSPTFIYVWLRDGTPISGASEGTYKVQSADAGHSLSCEVTAKNPSGAKSARSPGVSIPGGPGGSGGISGSTPLVKLTDLRLFVVGSAATVHIKCSDASCRGSGELTVQIEVRRHRGKKLVLRKETLVLAKGAFSLAMGKSGTFVLHLTATGRKRLEHAKHHPLTAKLTLLVQGGKPTVKSVPVS